MTAEALRDACDRNLIAAFAALVPHSDAELAGTRSFGTITAVATGWPIAFYNPVLLTQAAATPDELTAAVGWVRSLGFPASVQLREDLRHAGIVYGPNFRNIFRASLLEDPHIPPPRRLPGR